MTEEETDMKVPGFVRLGATWVNVDHIVAIEPGTSGKTKICLQDHPQNGFTVTGEPRDIARLVRTARLQFLAYQRR